MSCLTSKPIQCGGAIGSIARHDNPGISSTHLAELIDPELEFDNQSFSTSTHSFSSILPRSLTKGRPLRGQAGKITPSH